MLNRCIELASQLQNRKQRVAAIIADKKGRILSFGVNSYTKSHPKMAWYASKFNDFNKIFLHAEIASIIACDKKPHTIYIARVSKAGKILPSLPCRICQEAIKDAGIHEIVTT
jgi:deoxycytidylate deaminase